MKKDQDRKRIQNRHDRKISEITRFSLCFATEDGLIRLEIQENITSAPPPPPRQKSREEPICKIWDLQMTKGREMTYRIVSFSQI